MSKSKTKKGKVAKSDWTDYEHHFYDLCQERKWKVEVDEDGTPVLLPGRSSDPYKVYAHGVGRYGCCIIAEHGRTKAAIVRKMIKAKIPRLDESGEIVTEDLLDGDTDAIVFFSEDRLPRAVRTLNLKRKRHRRPSAETIEKGKAALAKWREEQKKNA